jgi:hypothetical protein
MCLLYDMSIGTEGMQNVARRCIEINITPALPSLLRYEIGWKKDILLIAIHTLTMLEPIWFSLVHPPGVLSFMSQFCMNGPGPSGSILLPAVFSFRHKI